MWDGALLHLRTSFVTGWLCLPTASTQREVAQPTDEDGFYCHRSRDACGWAARVGDSLLPVAHGAR